MLLINRPYARPSNGRPHDYSTVQEGKAQKREGVVTTQRAGAAMVARSKRTMAVVSVTNVTTRDKVLSDKKTSERDVFWRAICGNNLEKKYSIGSQARRTANQKWPLSGVESKSRDPILRYIAASERRRK